MARMVTITRLTLNKRRNLVPCVIITILFYTITHTFLLYDLDLMYRRPLEDITCHYSEANDSLQPADDKKISPSSKSIFFHETSCRRNLTSRQACAIESAARAHPDYEINVLFSAPISESILREPIFTRLFMFDNIKFGRIHIVNYAKGTPLEYLILSGALNKTHWRISHTSDVLRFLTLYKRSGIYLDMDVVVAKSLASLNGNWAARESDWSIAAGAMALSGDDIGRTVAEAFVKDISINFRGDSWGYNGPNLITRVLKSRCYTTNVRLMSSVTCQGFDVYGKDLFYPVAWTKASKYFVPGKLQNKEAYVYHIYNHVTKDITVNKNSPYAELARRYCPSTYYLYGDSFGT